MKDISSFRLLNALASFFVLLYELFLIYFYLYNCVSWLKGFWGFGVLGFWVSFIYSPFEDQEERCYDVLLVQKKTRWNLGDSLKIGEIAWLLAWVVPPIQFCRVGVVVPELLLWGWLPGCLLLWWLLLLWGWLLLEWGWPVGWWIGPPRPPREEISDALEELGVGVGRHRRQGRQQDGQR